MKWMPITVHPHCADGSALQHFSSIPKRSFDATQSTCLLPRCSLEWLLHFLSLAWLIEVFVLDAFASRNVRMNHRSGDKKKLFNRKKGKQNYQSFSDCYRALTRLSRTPHPIRIECSLDFDLFEFSRFFFHRALFTLTRYDGQTKVDLLGAANIYTRPERCGEA